MFNSTILDVMVGLAFVYLLLALICTTVNEWLSGIMKTRGKMLEKGITGLLQEQPFGDGQLLDYFKGHPLIAAQRESSDSKPSYIAPRTFALALMDLVTHHKPGPIEFSDLEAGIANLPEGCVKKSLLAVIQNTNREVGQAQQRIEDWFTDAMDRVSGWYKRYKQILTVIIASILTIFVNADTIGIANRLWVNPVLREEIVNRAKANQAELNDLITAEYSDAKNPKPARPIVKQPGNPHTANVERLHNQLEDIAGWTGDWRKSGGSFAGLIWLAMIHVPGWILTMIAVSLGAPFWFDILNRVMNIRAAGKSPAEPPKLAAKTA